MDLNLIIYSFIGFVNFTLFALAYLEFRKLFYVKIEAHREVLKISSIIKKAAITYLLRQFGILFLVACSIFGVLFKYFNPILAYSFSAGSVISWLCGFIAMYVSVNYNYKVALLAQHGFKKAFLASFSVGKIISFLVTGLTLAVCNGIYVALFYYDFEFISNILIGLSFGASLISIFARIGGGIFTKGADVGADLVGKLENNIPEDDARNPAVIADALGDNIGDACGMSADLFESFIVIFSGALFILKYFISFELFQTYSNLLIFILNSGIFGSIITLLHGWNYKKNAKFSSLGISVKGLIFALLFNIISLGCYSKYIKEFDVHNLIICVVIGLICSVFTMILTEYYTSKNFRPVKKLIEASAQGHANNIIQGLAIGLESTFTFYLMLCGSIFIAYTLLGTVGIAIACTSMISLAPVILALDAFGPVTDNAGGLVEMSGINGREVTDELDAIGNMTKATTKGYAVFTAGLATFMFSNVYQLELKLIVENLVMDINNLYVLIGCFLGAAIIALFTAFCLLAVNKASISIMNEVRAQFFAMPGIMNGTQSPDYSRAIAILTKASLWYMILPSLLPVISVLGLFFGFNHFITTRAAFSALGGFMLSTTVVGIIFAISMTISGGAWDNAKKAIESEGNKGSKQHQAAVTGDTVGDPYKDTAGPSINPMIKLISIVSVLITLFFK